MTPTSEDIAAMRTASNRRLVRVRPPLSALAAACGTAARAAAGPDLVDRLLDLALEAFEADRAFLLRARPLDGGQVEPVVLARRMARTRRPSPPSRTVALRALGGEDPFVWVDPARDHALRLGRSVRSLGLRWVLAAPLAGPAETRRALVIDSRSRPAAASLEEQLDLARGFAALLALGSDPVDPPERTQRLAARSEAMAATLEWIERVARTDLPALIHGESGSGKEVVARTIHDLGSRRAGPFVAVSCTELPDTLIEAELFGSERGSYTGAERERPGLFRSAHGGTLLLDEIGDMPLALQAKLLRALQEKAVRPIGAAAEVAVDVRVLAATHRDLRRAVEQGSFRGDLYYRLGVTEIAVPPLRRRRADLPLLVDEIGARLARETGLGPFAISAAATRLLLAHDWPGNVRELQSVLARALLRSSGAPIEPAHVIELSRRSSGGDEPAANLEVRMIRSALREACGSITQAARSIGWSKQKLYRRMSALGLR